MFLQNHSMFEVQQAPEQRALVMATEWVLGWRVVLELGLVMATNWVLGWRVVLALEQVLEWGKVVLWCIPGEF